MRWAIDGITDLIHEAIYADEPLGLGFDGQAGVYGYGGGRFPRQAPANLNYVMACVDAIGAKICKRRPMPIISADNAKASEKLFAKKSSRIIRRKMGGPIVESDAPLIVRDMLIRGTGVEELSRDGGDVKIERTPIYEYVFDPREAYYGMPRSVARVHPVPRELLIAQYPEHAEEILKAPAFNRADPWMMYVYQGPTFADHVEVARAIHLPSGPDEDDGQELVCIRGCVLKRKRWRRPRYPWARCFWNAPLRGFRGRGLVQQLAGPQCKINDIYRDAQEALFYGSTLKIFASRGSQIVKNHLRARHPVVIEHDGAMPQFVAPNPVSEQALRIMQMTIEHMKALSGLNDMSLQGKNPLGAQASGRALETMDDLQTDRFAHVELGYGQFRCEIARIMLDEAREMYQEAKTGKVDAEEGWEAGEAIGKDELAPWIAEHEWDRVDIDGGLYTLTLEPINFLPDSRAGKLEGVDLLGKAGLIPDPTMTASLFDEPDVRRMNRYILGAIDNIERMIEDLTDPSIPIENCLPTKYSNLALFVNMVKGEMEELSANREDEAIIDRFDHALKYAKDLIDQDSAAPSLPGMQSVQMGPAPNAGTLPPGTIPGAGPPPVPGGPMPGMAPPGIAA